jgi:RNA polymerase sigma-70 factor, ECF subfamily
MKSAGNSKDFYAGSLQRGERQGFNYFFQELHPPLTYFAFRLLNDSRDASEVTDRAFIQLWYLRKTFQQYSDVKFWLYTYVRNDCIKRMNHIQHQLDDDLPWQENASSMPAINDHILAEVMAELYGTIDCLPPDQKIIFEMLCIQSKSIETIAIQLNQTIDTIRVRRARAILFLQQKFELI